MCVRACVRVRVGRGASNTIQIRKAEVDLTKQKSDRVQFSRENSRLKTGTNRPTDLANPKKSPGKFKQKKGFKP